MEKKFLNIAGLTFGIHAENKIEIDPETRSFILNRTDSTDGELYVSTSAGFPPITSHGHWDWNRFYTKEKLGTVHIFDKVRNIKYAEVSYESRRRILISCLKDYHCDHTAIMLNLLGLEHLLIQYDALILHSSSVRHNGKGILFSAPSGTGKSTQAALWEQHMGADIINGDRAGLRKVDGHWRAYGLPFAGSSGIYRNESAPIAAIVLLRQGPENRILPLSGAMAFRGLFPEVSVQRWDEDFVNRVTDLLSDLLGEIPVYQLTCRPDGEAVSLLDNTLNRREAKWP